MLIARPLVARAPTLNTAIRENRSVMYQRVSRSLARNSPSTRNGSPPIQKPVASSCTLDSVMRRGRCSSREAAWLVITDALIMTRTSTGSARLATFLLPPATRAVNSAANSTMVPERKKFAPTTQLNGISAEAISTAESTYRYRSCTTARPTAPQRSSFHDDACTCAMLSADASAEYRAVHSTNITPPSSTDWKTRVPARSTTDRNENRSTSLTSMSYYFTVKGTSPLLM